MKKFYFYLFLAFFTLAISASPFRGKNTVVSGPSPYLPFLAKQIDRRGGNIFDVAVALAFTLSVTHPYYVSLGCGGFALVKNKNEISALDFREMAPQETNRDFYIKTGLSSQEGGSSVGVPGFVAGLQALHTRYGRRPWKELLEPAIKLAEQGFSVSGDWWVETSKAREKFNSSGTKFFLKKGLAYTPGDIFKQPQLAKALRLLQKKQGKTFYKGPIGQDILKTVRENKGVMTKMDLKSYKPRWLKPVEFSFRSHTVHSMPLPSSGGIILSRALALIEKQELKKQLLYSVEELHLLGEIMARAFRPRIQMGDLDNFPLDLKQWLSEKAISNLNQTILKRKVRYLPPLTEPTETTHFSIMNREGDVVAMTLTLNGSYGSYLVTDRYGITLNNQMDDFNTRPGQPNMYGLIQGKNNEVRGGRRPLSSMTPVIVTRNGKAVLTAGGAGGPAIITGVLQTIYRHLVSGLDIQEAVNSPRIHNQFLPRSLFVENKRFSPEVIQQLRGKGHKVVFRDYIAQIFAVSLGKDGFLHGGHDMRREGASGGY